MFLKRRRVRALARISNLNVKLFINKFKKVILYDDFKYHKGYGCLKQLLFKY